MEIDALLLMLLAVAAIALGKVGAWVLLIGTTYYLFMAARALVPRLRRDLPESMRRKAVCVLQGAVLIALVTPLHHRDRSDRAGADCSGGARLVIHGRHHLAHGAPSLTGR